jgi:hypothetical protein
MVVEKFKKLWLDLVVDFVIVPVLSADHCTSTTAFTLQNDTLHNFKSHNASTVANSAIEHRNVDKRTKHAANVARTIPLRMPYTNC